jgi:hypothetical protein
MGSTMIISTMAAPTSFDSRRPYRMTLWYYDA